jgi:hypothetical protein
MKQMALSANVDERGILKIRRLFARYGTTELMEAVFLELYDIISCNGNDLEAERFQTNLKKLSWTTNEFGYARAD